MTTRGTAVQSALLRLRHLISTRFAVGDQLPNEKTLADSLDVSRGTVREALGILAVEGVVTRQWGIGTFVSPPPPTASLSMSSIISFRDRVQSTGRTVTLQRASCELVDTPADVRAELQLALGAKAWRVERLFAVDGTPAALMLEHIPERLFGRSTDPSAMMDVATDLFEMLDRHEPGSVAHTTTDIEAVTVTGELARALGLEPGFAVVRGLQVTYGPQGERLAHGSSHQRTDLVRMRITR
jgi:GntR family transcriptional regulator